MKHENNWLGVNPLFISQGTGKSSTRMLELDLSGKAISSEGLKLYLLFGYSALQKTIFSDIEFTRPGEIVTIDDTGLIQKRVINEPPFKFIVPSLSADVALQRIESWVHDWEASFDGDIIIPLSGGLDSRLLLSFIKDKRRVHAYTYGLSSNPRSSHEVRIAEKIANQYKVKWQRIELDGFHRNLETWNYLFGPSTHAHGMYQIEFYKQISRLHGPGTRILSGIIGDAWAGSKQFERINKPSDVVNLALSHGLSDLTLLHTTNSGHNVQSSILPTLLNYFEENHEILKDERMRVVESMRIKMMLLRFLVVVPNHFGFVTQSPFLDSEIAQSMLSIRQEEWVNRKWQQVYFEDKGLNPKWLVPPTTQNIINLRAVIQGDVPSLDNAMSNYLDLPRIDHNAFVVRHKNSILFWLVFSRSNLLSLLWTKLAQTFSWKPTKAEQTLKLYTKFLLAYPLRPYI